MKLGRRPIEVPSGSVWGSWTVLGQGKRPPNCSSDTYFLCQCICGRKRSVSGYRLRKGNHGCLNCAARSKHEILDFTGQVIGKWSVISRIPRDQRRHRDLSWLCRCQCGLERALAVTELNRAARRSGGCRRCNLSRRLRPYEALFNAARERILRRYDRTKTYEFTLSYEEYLQIVDTGRCHYCHTPITWSEWKLPKKDSGHHLDRKENDQGYTKDNCVACCVRCNYGKGARYTYSEWWMMTQCFRMQINSA